MTVVTIVMRIHGENLFAEDDYHHGGTRLLQLKEESTAWTIPSVVATANAPGPASIHIAGHASRQGVTPHRYRSISNDLACDAQVAAY